MYDIYIHINNDLFLKVIQGTFNTGLVRKKNNQIQPVSKGHRNNSNPVRRPEEMNISHDGIHGTYGTFTYICKI